jgi:hypothetical protein
VTGTERKLPDAPLWAVVALVLGGLLAVAAGYWRSGLLLVALALGVGALLRLLLPAADAGLLVVRSRSMDVTVLAALGVGLGVLALVVPS